MNDTKTFEIGQRVWVRSGLTRRAGEVVEPNPVARTRTVRVKLFDGSLRDYHPQCVEAVQ